MKEFSYEQAYLFNNGRDFMSYNLLGAHYYKDGEQEGYSFAVWAPSAKSVSVAGDFNGWDTQKDKLDRMGDTGIFFGNVPGVHKWENYKYYIEPAKGEGLYKADPFAFHAETRPETSSKLYPLDDGFTWTDDAFIKSRTNKNKTGESPVNLYEVHLGSWKRGEEGVFLNYRDLAEQLSEYVLQMGYTHVELMPVMEHPLDESWGYQVTGYYAPTSRFGTPEDMKYFVDHMHSKGIGVIIDWVPGHFPKDGHALARFDGTPLFEYADDRIGEHKEWGTYVFNFARSEVRSFLISNAIYWVDKFHVDGIRVDAVSSMLYLNYGRDNHIFNKHGGVENIEAVEFLRVLNDTVHNKFPGVIMIAEEATAWPRVTAPTSYGGLGFDYKWNMGWMHDTLDYFSRDYIYRRWHHSQLSFSLVYAFSEKYILPLSHDEVVHGKKSLIDKMQGDHWRKFSSLRTLYAYMIAHPGAKLNFMGNEFGQFIEWRFYESLEWFLLEYENHSKLLHYVSVLNKIYLENDQLWGLDDGWDGFKWNCADDSDNCVYSFTRYSKSGKRILVVLNMTPSTFRDYSVGVEKCSKARIILDSDSEEFGGSGYLKNIYTQEGKESRNTFIYWYEDKRINGFEGSVTLDIPPNAAVYYMLEE